MFKNNNNNTKVRCEIYPVLTLKIPERCQWCGSDVFIVNYEHISYLLLMFLLSNWACKFQEEKEACIGPYQTSMVVCFFKYSLNWWPLSQNSSITDVL